MPTQLKVECGKTFLYIILVGTIIRRKLWIYKHVVPEALLSIIAKDT